MRPNHSARRIATEPRPHRAGAAAFALLLLTVAAPALAQDVRLENPAGTLRLSVGLDGGRLAYQVDAVQADGSAAALVGRSPLGIARTDAAFTDSLTLVSASPVREIDETYTVLTGKRRERHVRGREQSVTVRNRAGSEMTLVLRAHQDGVAFRYTFAGGGEQIRTVDAEYTGFRLPASGRVWMQPYQPVAQWAPAYESDYVDGVPVGTAAPDSVGWALPMLVQSPAGWALVAESDNTAQTFAVHLEAEAPGGLYRVRLPETNETYGVAPQGAAITLPWASPWRVVIAGSLATVVESTLVDDLAAPSVLGDVSWVRPGRATWSWLADMNSPRHYDRLVPSIDAAASLGWEYALLDLGWQEMGGPGIAGLVDYAGARGVRLLAWYNSSGRHTRVPGAGPTDLMADPAVRRAEMARLEALGVAGVKVDFFQSDKAYVMGLYRDILRDAADHHLLVNVHGSTVPRGWSRTFPNLMSMEAVRGGEQYWDSTFARNAPRFNATYPFTRNVVGPMDYTPFLLTGAAHLQPKTTTHAHELATWIVFESGIQHAGESAQGLEALPDYVRRVLRDAPVVWDETILLDGTPGLLAVVARRAGAEWFVAGVNGEAVEKTLALDLARLGSGAVGVDLVSDGAAPGAWAHTGQTLGRGEALSVTLAPNGGFVARLTPQN